MSIFHEQNIAVKKLYSGVSTRLNWWCMLSVAFHLCEVSKGYFLIALIVGFGNVCMFAVLQEFIQGLERCGVEIRTGDTVNGTPTHSAAKNFGQN
jgi:uncharacterized membrane protein